MPYVANQATAYNYSLIIPSGFNYAYGGIGIFVDPDTLDSVHEKLYRAILYDVGIGYTIVGTAIKDAGLPSEEVWTWTFTNGAAYSNVVPSMGDGSFPVTETQLIASGNWASISEYPWIYRLAASGANGAAAPMTYLSAGTGLLSGTGGIDGIIDLFWADGSVSASSPVLYGTSANIIYPALRFSLTLTLPTWASIGAPSPWTSDPGEIKADNQGTETAYDGSVSFDMTRKTLIFPMTFSDEMGTPKAGVSINPTSRGISVSVTPTDWFPY
jgi:hypothetical protein